MVCRSSIRIVVLGGVSALLLAQAIRAQSQQEKPQRNLPTSVSTDELNELTGKKVYPKIIIDDVKFEGPARLPDSGQEQAIITELKHHEFDAGLDWLSEILEVPIRGAWQDHGFFKANATGQTEVVSEDSAYKHVVIRIHVDEGLQYRLGDVRFRESDPVRPLVFAPEELRKLIPVQEGDVFNTTKIRESLDAIKKLYGSHGYINCVATPVTDADDATQRVSLIMELDEGKQFHVRKIEVFGLKPSKAAMLMSSVKPGDVFQYSLVEAFVKANLPGFLDVTSSEVLDLRKDQKAGTVDIVVDFRRLPKQF